MPHYTDDEFVDALPSDGGTTTTKYVAEAVGCTTKTANRRLKAIANAEGEPRVEFAFSRLANHYEHTTQEYMVRRIPEGKDPLYSPPSQDETSGNRA